jgi:hypothetical protein
LDDEVSARRPKNRTDREVAKAIALQMPDVELGSHHGTMDIRVRNRVFATFPAQSKFAVLKCTPEKLAAMTAERPEAFAKVRGDAWVQVALDEIDRAQLMALLIEAWALAAPPALRQKHEADLPNRLR